MKQELAQCKVKQGRRNEMKGSRGRDGASLFVFVLYIIKTLSFITSIPFKDM